MWRAQISILVAWWRKKKKTLKKIYGVIEKGGCAITSWALKVKLADPVKFPPPAVASREEIRGHISDMDMDTKMKTKASSEAEIKIRVCR